MANDGQIDSFVLRLDLVEPVLGIFDRVPGIGEIEATAGGARTTPPALAFFASCATRIVSGVVQAKTGILPPTSSSAISSTLRFSSRIM